MAPSAAPVATSAPPAASASAFAACCSCQCLHNSRILSLLSCLPAPAPLRSFAFVLVLVSVYFRAHFQSVPFVFLNFFHTLSFCARRLLICTPQLPWPPRNATAAINYSSDIMLPLPLPLVLALPLTALMPLHSALCTVPQPLPQSQSQPLAPRCRSCDKTLPNVILTKPQRSLLETVVYDLRPQSDLC